jgi:hypothetical protein
MATYNWSFDRSSCIDSSTPHTCYSRSRSRQEKSEIDQFKESIRPRAYRQSTSATRDIRIAQTAARGNRRKLGQRSKPIVLRTLPQSKRRKPYFFRGDCNLRKRSATANTAKNPNTPKIEYERMGRGATLLTAETCIVTCEIVDTP